MTVFVVISQPDGDWDHQASFLGVFSTLRAARVVAKGWKAAVIATEVDVPPTTHDYARDNTQGRVE